MRVVKIRRGRKKVHTTWVKKRGEHKPEYRVVPLGEKKEAEESNGISTTQLERTEKGRKGDRGEKKSTLNREEKKTFKRVNVI